ncbi:MAG: hypothetical protein ACQERZ_06890 [Fusobacteriota bacterium]
MKKIIIILIIILISVWRHQDIDRYLVVPENEKDNYVEIDDTILLHLGRKKSGFWPVLTLEYGKPYFVDIVLKIKNKKYDECQMIDVRWIQDGKIVSKIAKLSEKTYFSDVYNSSTASFHLRDLNLEWEETQLKFTYKLIDGEEVITGDFEILLEPRKKERKYNPFWELLTGM